MEEMKNWKIDLMSPVRIFFNKENWKNSLFIWLIIVLMVGIIDSILKINGQSNFILIINSSLVFLFFGYIRIYLNKAINSEENILPSINLKQIIFNALKLSIILIPMILLNIGLFIPLFFNLSSFLKTNNALNIIILTISVIVFVVINIFTIFVECAYLKDFKLSEGFKYVKIWKIFKFGWLDVIKTYFQAFFVITPIAGIFLFLSFSFAHLPIINKIKYVFILESVYYLVFDLIKINLIGQVYKNTLLKVQNLNYKQKLDNKTILTLIALLLICFFGAILIIHIAALPIKPHFYITHNFAINIISETYHISKYLILFVGYLINYTWKYLLNF